MKPVKPLTLLLLALWIFPAAAAAQNSVAPATQSGPGLRLSSQSPADPTQRSVPKGQPTSEVLNLTLSSAIDLALQQNLGVLLGNDAVLSSQGETVQVRSRLLPNFSARVAENAAQVNLAAQGFQKIAGRFGGGFPLVLGPFGFFDVRAYFSQALLDFNALHDERASEKNTAAEQLSTQDARELVTLVVGATYLDAITAASRVDTAEAQVQTAQALFNQASDLRNAGLSAGIDLLRAQVELQTRQQELISARNTLAKQNLVLARVVGLPLGQAFKLIDDVPYAPSAVPAVQDALTQALSTRADYQSAQARLNAAEEQRRAAMAEHLPSLVVNADYGVIGPTPGQTHGTYAASASLHIPIFSGNHAHGEALVAQAEIDRSKQRLDDLHAQIEQEVRTASLDLQAAADQVEVARSRIDLAQQTLTQARDRFGAGITNNIEIVQAQEEVVRANESYISSLRDYNLARMQLARATGSAAKEIRQYGKER